MSEQPLEVVVVVDIANVMGSRPDGWWRDRVAAATSLLKLLAPVTGAVVAIPNGRGTVRIAAVLAVLEGAARPAEGPEGVSVVRAERDGDSTIVAEASRLAAAQQIPLVVTADRGLRARLPPAALTAGPGWLNRLLGR